MKVLLTGSAGFIGTAVGETLERAGHEVVRVDAMLAAAHGETVAPPGTHQRDVRESVSWPELFAGVDLVCHQAALVGVETRAADLVGYAAHNDLGTAALLAAMTEHDVRRLVLASSMVVYGEGRYTCREHGEQTPAPRSIAALQAGLFENPCPVCEGPLDWGLVDEGARLDPRSGYAASKVAQEHYAAAWARQTGGSVAALRYHNVYGPGMPRDTLYSGVAAMFRSSLERGEAPRVYEDGGQMRDFVHVEDVARANLAAVEAMGGRSGFEAYNICSGKPVSILGVATAVAGGAATSLAPEVTGSFRAGDVRHVVASPRRAARELGFTARIGPEQGLADFATAPLRD